MEIQHIKEQLTIQTVLKYYGLQVNSNHMLNCPFHADESPSLKIYTPAGARLHRVPKLTVSLQLTMPPLVRDCIAFQNKQLVYN
ncbi:hypothetical protein DMA11_21710 [Marinilabiliaceae bacterium JC017]|nr:hypothetical protein DMA11_21710 [Marinilabiliaceae bacterium JC017]